ncbi:MAG: SDR family NAD(P)-dependent oxidoreductase [Desulfomonile tiedjei]|uniref:SDR family NAD(P)-dependent oxidoreductase n=1 Tax=Desulfomonile tiedjei TaxID=2358 RepID=A0A9D6UZV9_9BACT|nr:SDR family NAD(P)-dependent oxidoreductase [Desulfomonile tiedjei]
MTNETTSLKGKKALVTGAGGFIGSHLCEDLVIAGAQVRALVKYNSAQSHGLLEALPRDIHNSIEVMSGDIRDPYLTEKAVSGSNAVFHLAALIGIPYSYHAPKSYVDTNVSGTLNVLQACLSNGVDRVVHTSTSEVYGTARYTPIDENHPLQGQSPYSATKIAADKLAESYHLSFGLPVVTIRPFNCFGPGQSARAFIPAMISQILCNEKVCCGSLTPFRDYTYVKDTTAGFLACGCAPSIEGSTINVGSGKKISMGDLLRRIMTRMGVSKEIAQEPERVRPDASEVMELICDNARAMKLLNWQPRFTLDQGLDKVIESVKRNITAYKTRDFVL